MSSSLERAFQFDTSRIAWAHMKGGPEFDYPIDYKIAVLGCQPEHGALDLIVEFAPNSFCHFHRHLAATTTLVLGGEQHLIETSPSGESIHKVRPAGTYAHSPGGDVHMERGGPQGALVFFAMRSRDGAAGGVFDMLDTSRRILASSTIEEMGRGISA